MIKEKVYIFHYDFIHISCISDDDDWYGDFPVMLTKEDFDTMLSEYKKWYKSDEWHDSLKNDDDEYFLLHFCPVIHKKVRAALQQFAEQNWRKEVVDGLDQADIIMPDEIYHAVDPESSMDAQSDYFWNE